MLQFIFPVQISPLTLDLTSLLVIANRHFKPNTSNYSWFSLHFSNQLFPRPFSLSKWGHDLLNCSSLNVGVALHSIHSFAFLQSVSKSYLFYLQNIPPLSISFFPKLPAWPNLSLSSPELLQCFAERSSCFHFCLQFWVRSVKTVNQRVLLSCL